MLRWVHGLAARGRVCSWDDAVVASFLPLRADNGVGPAGAADLAKALEKNSTVTTINLRGEWVPFTPMHDVQGWETVLGWVGRGLLERVGCCGIM